MKLKCLLVGHDWVEFINLETGDYICTSCDSCGELATARDCDDCDGQGWLLGEDVYDNEAWYSSDGAWWDLSSDLSCYLCPSCDGYGVE